MGIIQYNCKCKEETKTCPECKQESHDWKHYTNLRESYCFSCNFWQDLVEEQLTKLDIYFLRIKGHHYQTHKEEKHRRYTKYNGFAGRQFIIKLDDTEEIFDTYNLWHQGKIPEHFRDRLPDNAEFVEDKSWVKMDTPYGIQECLADVVK